MEGERGGGGGCIPLMQLFRSGWMNHIHIAMFVGWKAIETAWVC